MAFKPANCPTCGGPLQVPDDKDIVKCMYCGGDIIVREVIRVQTLANVSNLVNLARIAMNGGNADEAYRYYTQVLEYEGTNSEAWFGKAEAAGWSSTLANLRIPEMLACFGKAIESAPTGEQVQVQHRAADSISKICVALYSASQKHTLEFISLDTTWSEHLNRCNAEWLSVYKTGTRMTSGTSSRLRS